METLGRTHAIYIRKSFADYPDGNGRLMWDYPDVYNARKISNECLADDGSGATERGISDMLWQFGQFLDHDMDLGEISADAGTAPIDCPDSDMFCSPGPMDFQRTIYQLDENGVRQQENFITSLIDGSGVYGSDDGRAQKLRTKMDGKMATSAGNLLPFNDGTLENAGGTSTALMVAGDIRANEQLGLLAMVSSPALDIYQPSIFCTNICTIIF